MSAPLRSITWRRPGTIRMVDERLLNPGEFQAIRGLFIPKDGDPELLDSYAITTHHAEQIEARTGIHLKMDRYEYTLECWKNGP